MDKLKQTHQRICFIGNSTNPYLKEYIHLTNSHVLKVLSFKNLKLAELKFYSPTIIVVDEYFSEKDYSSLINSIKLNFKGVYIFFMSPKYANNKDLNSTLNKNHFYSNFNLDLINRINNLINKSDKGFNYQEAS